MRHQRTAVPSRREAGPVSSVIAGRPWRSESRDTGTLLAHRQDETGAEAV
jgi:hypothetical protein